MADNTRCDTGKKGHIPAMSTTLVKELATLPVEQKLALMEELWESIPKQAALVRTEHIAIARQRLAELRTNPATGLTLDQLKARLG